MPRAQAEGAPRAPSLVPAVDTDDRHQRRQAWTDCSPAPAAGLPGAGKGFSAGRSPGCGQPTVSTVG